ncbi:serine/threonine-protein kinase LMTK1 isoform X3 [Denticeps clupeoides]|uniref:serine/threonine-protein kinase LMTK1 isoform X3 n=1 Tax=Denticeps clupeoides TaxID=299321 RepID=UPI0010A56D77|nr:serine/threonine-protein kinase LMTK1-like isoform X3 [Denticeps clupeoides]
MSASALVVAMSPVLLSPSFAFSSHFDSGGAPLSELSWPSSLAVVAVSFSGLFTFVFLMLACLCCKKGDINFKEFENTEGDEYQADISTLASPTSQNGPEVYILPLTEVSLPVSKQPGRSIKLLKSADLGRHNLLYLKEIGHGWFGKVLLGEVNVGLSNTQVVVKELKASASVQDQMQFLEEVQPYRALQHPSLLQCLAQCTEVTPYLLVMEFCPLGDLKGYLHSCQASETVTPDPLTLQRMACEIASGLMHLHKHNYIHSDLALRNCLLSSEMTVKIGDYGFSHSRYKDDYFVTADQIWVPLRWIAPELIDEVHGNLLVVDQTKASNVWSLGVTIWELFELGNQPYRHYSDRQVLTYAVKEQQLKLPKPLLKIPLSERWYEVMQFCWLQPEQRPVAEEVHLLLSYLCAKGASEAQEDFEKRWNSLRPSLGSNSSSSSHHAPAVELGSSASSSFPLLENFTADSFHPEAGDDILTVTETSHGLNFEYKWEKARAEQPYCASSTTGTLGQSNPEYQDIYYPLGNVAGSCSPPGVSPSYYKSDHPGVVPVLSAHSPSVSSEYYIRIEEPVECNIDLEDRNLDFSPGIEASNRNFSMGGRECMADGQSNMYWSAADGCKTSAYDSDTSPDISLSMESLHRRVSGASAGEQSISMQYFTPREAENLHILQSPQDEEDGQYTKDHKGTWRSRSHTEEKGSRESPMVDRHAVSSPGLECCDPYLEGSHVDNHISNEGYYDLMGPLQKSVPRSHYISINSSTGDGLLVTQGSRESGDNDDFFIETEASNWSSNRSANNNSSLDGRQIGGSQDVYLDLHYTTPSPSVKSFMSTKFDFKDSSMVHNSNLLSYLEATGNSSRTSRRKSADSTAECGTYIHLCQNSGQEDTSSVICHPNINNSQAHEQVSHSVEKNALTLSVEENMSLLGESVKSKVVQPGNLQPSDDYTEPDNSHTPQMSISERERRNLWGIDGQNAKLTAASSALLCSKKVSHPEVLSECISVSDCSRGADSGVEAGGSSISLVDVYDCSDDEITDVASGVFADSPLDYAGVGEIGLVQRSMTRQVRTSGSEDAINLASSSSPCESFSPDSFPPIQPKSLDSGYDTENNESPEFIFKDLEAKPMLCGSLESDDPEMVLQLDLDEGIDRVLLSTSSDGDFHNERNNYRDSAYFSDYDNENDRSPCDTVGKFFSTQEEDTQELKHKSEKEECVQEMEKQGRYNFAGLKNIRGTTSVEQASTLRDIESGTSPTSTPRINTLSPFPPQMGGCLTKESTPDDGLGLESEHSAEEATSNCSTSTPSEGSSSSQEPSASVEDRATEDYSPTESLGSNSTTVDLEVYKEREEREDCTDGEENPVLHVKMKEESHLEDKDGENEQSEEHHGFEAVLNTVMDGPLEATLASPDAGLDVVPIGDGDEADEEDSDDSEESDEELRSYNIHEQSDESEEEFTTVPVVVSERASARHLRSLLKMPSLLTQSFCDELERKKKAVSFFDDVTVFLFDQESPTGELADYSFPSSTEGNGHILEEGQAQSSQPESLCVSDKTETNISEDPDSTVPPPCPPPKAAEEKSAVQYSRFSVSRFSITNVSDTDVGSIGGGPEESIRK